MPIETVLYSLYTDNASFRPSLSWAMSCVLSVGRAARHFKKLVLVTDDKGKSILGPTGFKLPFTEVNTALNGIPKRLSFLPMIGKLYAYREMKTPFLHLDFDLFLHRKPSLLVIDAPAAAQAVVSDPLPEMIMLRSELEKTFPQLPKINKTTNAGFFAVNDMATLAAWLETTIAVAEDEKSEPILRKARQKWHATSALEEMGIAGAFGQRLVSLLPDRPLIGGKRHWSVQEWDAAGFTHLNGGLKAEGWRKVQTEMRAYREFPTDARRAEDYYFNEMAK